MTTARQALRLAVRDFYGNSWRLVAVNAALGLVVVGVAFATLWVRAAVVLIVLAGPVAAALMHVAVTLVQADEDVRIADALAGLRLHWRRGLALASLGGVTAALGLFAALFYATQGGAALPFGFAALYVVFMLGVYQLLLWPLAIQEPHTPLRELARRALAELMRRPLPSLGLGIAVLLVNAVGIAAGAMPFLTLTVAYTFLAAAHFALPHRPLGTEAR